jgi:hypothetical protein
MYTLTPAQEVANTMVQSLWEQGRGNEPRFFSGALAIVWALLPEGIEDEATRKIVVNLYNAAGRNGFVDC